MFKSVEVRTHEIEGDQIRSHPGRAYRGGDGDCAESIESESRARNLGDQRCVLFTCDFRDVRIDLQVGRREHPHAMHYRDSDISSIESDFKPEYFSASTDNPVRDGIVQNDIVVARQTTSAERSLNLE